PRYFVPDLDDGLTQLLFWGLAKDPAARPQTVTAWLNHLERAAERQYGPRWAESASLGAIAGAATIGGIIASGALTATTATTATGGAGPAAAAGSGAAKAGVLSTPLAKALAGAAATAVIATGGITTALIMHDDSPAEATDPKPV